MRYYVLRGRVAPWGDYGYVLWHGIVTPLNGRGPSVRLRRAGPHVPPLTFPSPAVPIVTDAGRERLEKMSIEGLGFRPVIKEHIARIDWISHIHDSAPPLLPASGEPEDYLATRPRDEELSRQIGALWQVTADALGTATSEIVAHQPRRLGWRLGKGDYRSRMIFVPSGIHCLVVDERGKDGLSEAFGDDVVFQEMIVAS